MHHLPCYLYLDSKITGTAKQIASFFEQKIFSAQKTTVLIKKYKHKSSKQIAKIFKKHQIDYCFVKAADVDALENGIVFYPFNAQSNCRVVANRKLCHIFITHGESNKITSAKPILRIYDYVVTAGQAGIDRLLNSHIFCQHDIDSGRIISMGDTFVGKTGLSPKGQGKPVVFYAPTWEGGIESENYSSLSHTGQVGRVLIQAAQKARTNTVVIKPHPNTGHRLKEYTEYLTKLINILKNHQLCTIVYLPHFKLPFHKKWQLSYRNVFFKNSLEEYTAETAFCDISAMETQLLNENTDYYIFMKQPHIGNHFFQGKHFYFESIVIELGKDHHFQKSEPKNYQNLKSYMIDDSFEKIPTEKRIGTLINIIRQGTSL